MEIRSPLYKYHIIPHLPLMIYYYTSNLHSPKPFLSLSLFPPFLSNRFPSILSRGLCSFQDSLEIFKSSSNLLFKDASLLQSVSVQEQKPQSYFETLKYQILSYISPLNCEYSLESMEEESRRICGGRIYGVFQG